MSIKSRLIKRAKYRAKKKGWQFDITEDDFILSSFCPILGIPLHVNEGHIGGMYNSPTLDRIRNDIGYVRGNIVVISQLANQMKSNANTNQLKTFAEWLNKNYE